MLEFPHLLPQSDGVLSMLRINLSTLKVFSITGLAHQAFCLLQLLLQKANTLSQLF